MKVPLRWLREYVSFDLSPEELARTITFAGLEVEGMFYLGLPQPTDAATLDAKVTGIEWDRDRIVVGDLLEVRPHPDAEKLVLADVDHGSGVETVVTGAPNLGPLQGKGRLDPPLKVALAKEGARLYDGHANELKLKKLKRTKIRGVESAAMVCSEKELGISEEHEGVIVLDAGSPAADAPAAGTPLADHLGDVVLDIDITPNMARNASILGVAREVAALTDTELRPPSFEAVMEGSATAEKIRIEIRESELNPRFTATLIEGIEIKPSPYWMQVRLSLAGMRPISNVVDVTNYVMLELGQPLHAFDYDVLVERAKRSGAEVPTIVTRLPEKGERLETLDGVDRELDDFTILVCDTAGAISLGGIMGGGESEVSETTTNVLLEAASWDMINVRKSVKAQQLETSGAAYRFSRGVHPEQSRRGNLRAAEMMRQLAGGQVAEGIVDVYPKPAEPVSLDFPLSELERYLGPQTEIAKATVVRILEALEFGLDDLGDVLRITVPDHRVDISPGIVGIADLVEEIARIYGYERIGETQISDTIPPQHGNPELEREESLRDLLVQLGLQEIITYRLTTPEREARVLPPGAEADPGPWVRLKNPATAERTVMRRSLLASALEVAETNLRFRDRLAIFDVGSVYLPVAGEKLPEEPRRLALVLTGPREEENWTEELDETAMDFYDLKGVVEGLVASLHLDAAAFEPARHPSFHPGRTALLRVGDEEIGVLGELHPQVRAAFELSDRPVLAAEFDLEALLGAAPSRWRARELSRFPAIREDLAVIVDESTPAAAVEAEIRAAGGSLLDELRLFDLYRGEQVDAGKKSLAYRLSYRSEKGTLSDKDAGKIRGKILERLEKSLGAVLR